MFIITGRGARMRGEEPQGEGRSLPAVTHSPLSLRFSPSRSLIPYSLLSKFRSAFVDGILGALFWGEVSFRFSESLLGVIMPTNSDLL